MSMCRRIACVPMARGRISRLRKMAARRAGEEPAGGVGAELIQRALDRIYRIYENSCNPNFCIYNNWMDIAYDPAKDASNANKHGVSLGTAADFEWDEALTWVDERQAYGEIRMCAIGYISNRLFYMAYVDRDDVRRIISLRKANSREVKRYAEA